MQKTKKERRKKIIFFLYILSILGYAGAFFMFLMISMDFGESSQIIKFFEGFFLMGVVFAEISMMFKIPEQDIWSIEEKREHFTEEEKKEIERLLSELDD